jgi:sialate O-acetylesterase
MEAAREPSESTWALMREAQAMALSEPHTGMAVAIDLGEWNDIHPLNKKDVGHRLALAARKIAYGESSLAASGPVFSAIKLDSARAVISFSHLGSGLVARGEEPLRGFAIAGADRKFVWANARIVDSTVVVWNESVPAPKAVRYAWASNPAEANLYNVEGLPASPFRTDNWSAK